MEKKITDYAHLYAPYCSVILREYNRKFSKWGWCVNTPYHFGLCKLYEFEEEGYTDYQLILRPLSSMTHEELQECGNLVYDFSDDNSGLGLNEHRWEDFTTLTTAEQFHWLLQRGFDLFGLITDGLALNKQSL